MAGNGEWGKAGASAARCHQGKELHRDAAGLRPAGSPGLDSSSAELADLSITGEMQTGASGRLVISIVNEVPEQQPSHVSFGWCSAPGSLGQARGSNPPASSPAPHTPRRSLLSGTWHSRLYPARFGMHHDNSTGFPCLEGPLPTLLN